MTTAITSSMLALCSAACKALRFASTAHPRGLRALTPTSAQPDEGRLRDGRARERRTINEIGGLT
jgi:hypothetical protein